MRSCGILASLPFEDGSACRAPVCHQRVWHVGNGDQTMSEIRKFWLEVVGVDKPKLTLRIPRPNGAGDRGDSDRGVSEGQPVALLERLRSDRTPPGALNEVQVSSQALGFTAVREKLGQVLGARERAELHVLVINDTNVGLTKNKKLGIPFGRCDTEPDVTSAPGHSDEFSVSGAGRVVGGVSYELKGQQGTGW